MADKSAIEWTEATWNPVTGCSKVSPGCAHCYAETLSLRYGWSKLPWTPENAEANVVLHPERLDVPSKWRRPRMIFVNSMSDLFHEQVPTGFIEEIFVAMARTPRHTFQVLTKRPERAREILSDPGTRNFIVNRATSENTAAARARGWSGMIEDAQPSWPLPNVWLGTSIENMRHVGRASVLRDVPATVRFISAEPLLGPLAERIYCPTCWDGEPNCDECEGVRWWYSQESLSLDEIDWLIVGGESGHGARPMREEWALELRDMADLQCIPFFFKQWGGRTPKAGGKILDGREWCEMPNAGVLV